MINYQQRNEGKSTDDREGGEEGISDEGSGDGEEIVGTKDDVIDLCSGYGLDIEFCYQKHYQIRRPPAGCY